MNEQLQYDYRYSGVLQYFLECVRENKDPAFCRGRDGLATIEAINAAYLSALENRTMALPLNEDYDLEEVFRLLGAARRIGKKS